MKKFIAFTTLLFAFCLTKAQTQTTITVPSTVIGPFCPKTLVAGDRDFAGRGPAIIASAEVSFTRSAVMVTVKLNAKETVGGDNSETNGSTLKTIYNAPKGYYIADVTSGKKAEVRYVSKSSITKFSPGGLASVLNVLPLSITDVSDGLVKSWEIAGDTNGADISTDDNCDDDTRIIVTLNDMKVKLISSVPIFNQGTAYSATVTDIDGNTYRTFRLGDHFWMAENLRVTRYRNGIPITNIIDNAQWQKDTSGAWSNYNNDKTYDLAYGKLYNAYAVKSNNGICPDRWHVATKREWENAAEVLGGMPLAAGKLKSTALWVSPNTDATNSSGFSALPAGARMPNGSFEFLGSFGFWWEIIYPSNSSDKNFLYLLQFNQKSLNREWHVNGFGYSVRCVLDYF